MVQRITIYNLHLLCAKKMEIESHLLPPSNVSFDEHTLRSNY